MLSIVIFIYEMPIGYTVSGEGGRYYFEPAQYSEAHIAAPCFWAFKEGGHWKFDGLEDSYIMDQIINLPINFIEDTEKNKISAAP